MDDFKKSWDKGQDVPPAPIGLPAQTTLTTVQQLKARMRRDFTMELALYTAIAILLILTVNSPLSLEIAAFTVLSLGFQAIYFNRRFKLFYRMIDSYDLALITHVRKIAYDLEVNMEVFRTYTFCSFPLAALILLLLIQDMFWQVTTAHGKYYKESLPLPWVILCLALLLVQLLVYPMVNRHIRRHYGSYVKQLKQLIETES